MPKDNQKERIMHYLKVSAEEAEEIIAADKAIDRGERMDFDLSPEQEKVIPLRRVIKTRRGTFLFYTHYVNDLGPTGKKVLFFIIPYFLNNVK